MNAPNTSPDAKLGAPSRRDGRLLTIWRRLRGVASPARAALSVGLGVFIGCLPLYGVHLPLCLLICVPLRLDAVLAYVGANISNPFFAPVLLSLELQVGALLLTGELLPFTWSAAEQLGAAGVVRQVALGSGVVGVVLGVTAGAVVYAIARRRADSAFEQAVRRTTRRYRGAPVADRMYVGLKLRIDPVLTTIAQLGPLGAVVDAGCGRGQLVLALLELGRVSTVSGFDFDARKVEVARRAGGADGRFEVGDLRESAFERADTLLLIDVLHYLPLAEQDAVLARARASLVPRGRVIVREVDHKPSTRSYLSRVAERIGTRIGYNRAAARLEFRSTASVVERLTALGLECRVLDAGQGTPFDNRLVVGTAPPERDQASSNSLQNSSTSSCSSSA